MERVEVLASGVAHVLNNLLTPMIGYAIMLREGLSPEKARMADIIVENGNRAAQLVSQLLSYAGKGECVISPVDLTDCVRSMRDLLKASVPNLVRLNTELQSDLPPVWADPRQIKQIIIDLVRNAAEAIPKGRAGLVSLRTSLEEITAEGNVVDELSHTPVRPGEHVCLEVQDDGIGIDVATRSKLFDPFFTTKVTGRGLGLPAAAGILRSHHGAIEVSSAPSQGAIFRVYFPLSM
jgi:two-component system cell cycle sensor histidine kinase/response regulator CckA